jgi:two-component system chemotaxis sensor kinase CheA
MSVFKRILSDRAVFEEFFDEATELVRLIRASDGSDPAGLARAVHTLKGNAGIYGLESIAELCHTLENELESSPGPVSDARKRELEALWARVGRIHAEFSADPGIIVGRDEHRELSLALEARGPSDLATRLASWRFEPASRRLELMARQIKALAQRLGKGDVEVRLEPTELRLPGKRWAPIWTAMTHVVRNTVDHGLEAPAQRVEKGKSEQATVTLSLRRARHDVILTVRDDGRGIDWAAIAKRGRSLGMPVDRPEDLEAALFAPGVSSRDVVTATSGRGVGLSAVREVVSALGGRIEVWSEAGAGTQFTVRLPVVLLEERSGWGPAAGLGESTSPRSAVDVQA